MLMLQIMLEIMLFTMLVIEYYMKATERKENRLGRILIAEESLIIKRNLLEENLSEKNKVGISPVLEESLENFRPFVSR